MLAAVSTEHKIGLLVVAGAFIGFALASSFLFPRYWPQFPGSRGLGAFVAGSLVLFVAMVLAVEFFAVEEEEAEAGNEPAAVEETQTTQTATTGATETTGTTETAQTTETAETTETAGTTTAAAAPRTITVSGTEFAFALSATEFEPGSYVLELRNAGQIGHDLAVEGPGVDGEKTPVIDAGETAELDVELREGDYELWCTVPGHRDAGMETELTVS